MGDNDQEVKKKRKRRKKKRTKKKSIPIQKQLKNINFRKRMPRMNGEKYTHIVRFRIDDKQFNYITKQANDRGWSFSEIVRDIIQNEILNRFRSQRKKEWYEIVDEEVWLYFKLIADRNHVTFEDFFDILAEEFLDGYLVFENGSIREKKTNYLLT